MKKIFLILTLMSLTLSVFSQVKFGVRAGLAYYMVPQSNTGARIKTTPVKLTDQSTMELLYSKNNGIGYNFGLFLDIPVTNNFVIQIEPSFAFRNYNEVLKDFEIDTLLSVQYENYIFNKLTYLELPILFKYNLKPNTGRYGRKSYFSVFAGAQVGLFLGKKEENKLTSIINLYGQTTVNTDGTVRSDNLSLEYNPIDIAAVGGVMYDFEKGLRLGVRYVGSLMPVNSNINFDIYHHSVQMTVGFNFIPQ
ncbi:PorT family protein [Flavobacteriales bacterium]|nr:PorT family protein [Flavobacteriales bacterium]